MMIRARSKFDMYPFAPLQMLHCARMSLRIQLRRFGLPFLFDSIPGSSGYPATAPASQPDTPAISSASLTANVCILLPSMPDLLIDENPLMNAAFSPPDVYGLISRVLRTSLSLRL